MKEKILKFVARMASKLNIRTDLLLHLLVSMIIAFSIGVITKSSFLTVSITLFIGLGKEIYDMFKENPTGFDIKDLLFDGLGCMIGFLLSGLVLAIISLL